MAIETQRPAQAPEGLDELATIYPYKDWQRREGLPVVTGYYVEDLGALDVTDWPSREARGTFVNLEGTGGVNDLQLLEISAGGATAPVQHMFEALVYVVAGRGSSRVGYSEAQTQTFEWGPGSLFAIPLNATYRFFNASGSRPARLAMVTNAPTIMNLFHSDEFMFNNPFIFQDRFAGEEGYFGGDGKLWRRARNKVWDTNFVSDVRKLQLYSWKERGAGGFNVMIELARSTMSAHISQFPVGTYKKAHRHGPGAHVVILDGVGFSTLWREGEQPIRCNWKPNSVVVPPDQWFHQHFNTGADPARYLALKFAGRRYQPNAQYGGDRADVSIKQGGNQLEYEDEDQRVHDAFEAELRANGAECRMKGLIAWCTGQEGPPDLSPHEG
ncbi:MAG TPA: ethanolamine ammonia lyase-activating protein [Chloroflexota bacterium]|nr:ethanolamine ammonia lyase-activating protein [Chloroflexota bacterium]